MGSKDFKAKVRLEGDASGATKAITKTEKGFDRLTSGAKRLSAGTVAAFLGAAVAIRGFASAVTKAVKASQVQEDAVNALDGALERLGDNAGRVSKALQDQASALQQVTKFGDEEIIQAQALIASFVGEESQIKAATRATLDLAQAKGMSLVTAADLISKTLGSSTNALSRYGIEVEGVVGSTERLASLTGSIESVFGGRAAKAAETFSGKMQQLQNAIGDTYEEVGFALTKNDALIRGLDEMKGNVESLTPAFGELAAGMVEAGVGATNLLVQFGSLIYEWNQWLGTIDNVDDAMAATTVNASALEATAARLGVTVETLRSRLSDAGQGAHVLTQGARDAAVALDDAASATERAAAAQSKLDNAAKASASAMEDLGEALGVVTSAQLAAEVGKIEAALASARIETGGLGREFEDMEAIARQQIDSLTLRMDGLRDGVGDIGQEAADAALGFGKFADAVDDAGESVDDFGGSVVESTRSLSDMNRTLDLNQRFLHNTAIAYDALAKKIGEANAQQAALASGMAKLTQDGTRIRFAGGGSRLVNTSGTGSSGVSVYSLSPFGTGGRVVVDPDGSVRPL